MFLVFLLPSVSYINLDFRLADYSACHLLACWFLAELISTSLKMDAICSSETSVDTQWTTWRYIPEVDTFQIKVWDLNLIYTLHHISIVLYNEQF
jgi:hypothetical protein